MLKFTLGVLLILGIFSSAYAYSVTLSSLNPQYDGYYWGYATSGSGSSLSLTNPTNGWSALVEYTSSGLLDSCTNVNDPVLGGDIYWGDSGGTYNNYAISSGYLKLDGGSYTVAGSGNLCNVSVATYGAVSGYPITAFYSAPTPQFYFYHIYNSIGTYTITGDIDTNANANPPLTTYNSNSLAYMITNPANTPTLTSSNPMTSVDIGSFYGNAGTVVSTTGTCGSGATCGEQEITSNNQVVQTSTPIITSGNSISYSFSPNSAGAGIYSFQGLLYDPVARSQVGSSTITTVVYPTLQNPTLSINQNPTGNTLISNVSLQLNITVPAQIAGSDTESPAYATINWGDGHTQSNILMSLNSGNYVLSENHTYATGGNYNIQVTLQSNNYVTLGSEYGTTSSSSDPITVATYGLTATSLNPFYSNYYWGYAHTSNSSNSLSTTNGWSTEINLVSSITSCSLTSDSIETNWNDSTSNYGNFSASGVFINGINIPFLTTGNGCGFPYQTVANSSTYPSAQPETAFYTGGTNGGSTGFSLNLFHTFTNVGTYTISASDNYGSSNLLNVEITNPPSNPSISDTNAISAMDLGSTITLKTIGNCGGGSALCGQQSIINSGNTQTYATSSSLTPASGSQLTYNFNPTQAGVYSFKGAIYDPVAQATVQSTSTVTDIVYPDISTPTLSINPSSGSQFYTNVPVQMTITVPSQTVGGNTESPAYATINWGDGAIQSNVQMSLNGGYYTYTTNHTYSLTGSETIQVSLQSSIYQTTGSSYGSTNSTQQVINIQPYVLPSVAISLPTNNICAQQGIYSSYPATYGFSLTAGSFPITTFSINWGDTQITTINNPSSGIQQVHTYSSSGSYTIIATATDSQGHSSSSQTTLVVNQFLNPAISSSITPSAVTATQSNSYSISVTQGTCPLNQIIWSWGDASSNTDLNAVQGVNSAPHIYQIPQGQTTKNYNIQVSLSDTAGNIVQKNDVITVNYTYPTISAVSPSTVYNTPSQSTYSNIFNATISGGNNTVSFSNIQWNFGDNSPNQTGLNIPHQYANTGTYNITITAMDNAGYYTVNSTQINVVSYPNASVNAFTLPTAYQGITQNYAINITEAPSGYAISSIIWSWGDNSTTIQTNPNYGNMTSAHSYAQAGTYTILVRVIDVNNVQESNSTSITVNPYVPPLITNYSEGILSYVNPSNSTIATLNNTYNISITAGSYNVTEVQYSWGNGLMTNLTENIGAGNMSNISQSFAYSAYGSYTIIITATDSNGLSATLSEQVSVLPYTNPKIIGFTPVNVIVNETTNYTATFQEGSVPLNYTTIDFNGVNKTVNTTQINGLSPNGGSVTVPFLFNNSVVTPVNVSISDIFGNSTNQIFNVNVQSLPLITAFYNDSFNSGNLYTAINTTFTINMTAGTNSISNLTFNFGDGNSQFVNLSGYTSPISISINHTYAQGTYTANFTVYDSANNSELSYNDIVTITAYKSPEVINITPINVYDVVSNNYTFNISAGYFNTSNVTVNWGDNSSNTTIQDPSNVNLVYANHTYPFAINSTYTITATACDVNNFCLTNSKNITATYGIPIINSISPTTVYSGIVNNFTFNITQGTFNVSSMNIFWGDNNISQPTISNTSPVENHTYASAGTYTLQAFVIDTNQQSSNQFSTTITVTPYVMPTVSKLTPVSVTSGINQTYTFTVTQGILPLGNLTINWGNGDTLNYSVVNGSNSLAFNYTQNGTFTAVETICDTGGICTQNNTLIQSTQYPWNFTTPESIINYTITNNSTPVVIQLSENDILPINYSIQALNVVPDYSCSVQISPTGLFSVLCSINPNVVNLNPQTAYYSITAEDTDGVINTITERVNIVSAIQPAPLSFPYNVNQSVTPPSPVYKPFQPIPSWVITLVTIVATLAMAVGLWRFRKKKVEEEEDEYE
ncbi:MAG: beta strand repeat-containing protein [Gammaproteobacteria bacterium]